MMLHRRTLLAGATAATFAIRPARAEVTLRCGDQRGNNRAVMEAAGVMKDLPYRIAWSEFVAAAPLVEALNAGAIDAGVVGDAPFTFGFASGVPMRAIAARRSTQQGTAIVVRGDSPAHAFTDLKGKKIATTRGSIGHFLILAALRRAGLPDDAVKIVFLQPADAKAALTSGSIDAWSTWEPYTSQVEVVDGGRQVTNGQGLTPGQGFQIASTDAIAAKREQLADFITRLTAARIWANAHRDEYATIWAKLMGFPVEVPRHWFARTTEEVVPTDARVIADEQKVIDLYASAGMLRKPFDAASGFDTSFNPAVEKGSVKS
jgi:sulfonate transport system substrate-binding protein